MSELQKFAIVPYEQMDELLQKVNALSEAILKTRQRDNGPLGDYISEKEAQNLLSRRGTWFWNVRKAGKLKGKKAGGSWFYRRSDILAFIENGSP